tara:strand:+ start:42 stop:404 length:363 start_codon:yes stop_codon:yes gene_type:complete
MVHSWKLLSIDHPKSQAQNFKIHKKGVNCSMPNDLLSEMHSSTSVDSGVWADFRAEATGMYLLSGSVEYNSQHVIREYNRNVFTLESSWTGDAIATTGLLLRPFNDGFSYIGTGDFTDYP